MKTILFILIVLTISVIAWSQTDEFNCSSAVSSDEINYMQRGGRYLTASGDLKVLVVFAKFKDDNSPHQFWPADSYPSEMNDFIDPDMQTASTHFLNLTNYYNQMSFGNFRVTGKAIGVETPYPIGHYTPDNEQYANRINATTDILHVVDDLIDYREFDNWTYNSNYYHINEPDDIIDMIIVIWRGLVFTDIWNGESTLGKGPEFLVENNEKIIKMGFGGYPGEGSYGSGVTVQCWSDRTRERNFKVTIHEVAHWLIHNDHPYSDFRHTFWGMLTLGSEGICANAFEREQLAWLNPTPIEGTILSAPMGDFVTTPSAYKYHPDNGFPCEMYYFENHQQISIYDNGISNPDDKGIFILHVSNGFYVGDCVRLLTADGFWNWDAPLSTDCWGNNLPVFKKKYINRNGFGNRDRITSCDSACGFLYSYINEQGLVECNDWLHGYGFNNAFNIKFNDVFSPWSNPPAKTYAGQQVDFIMEVISQSGSIITARFAAKNVIGCKPSKPPLGFNPQTLSNQNNSDHINLAWGADFWDGQPIESDVDWLELQMRIDAEEWTTIYSGTNRSWNDSNYVYNTNGYNKVSFRVRLRDSQNYWSIWSDLFETRITKNNLTSLDDINTSYITEFHLYQNYPNPFNPVTIIQYSIPKSGHVSLKIYDVLGNEVASLVNEEKSAGNYEVDFDAKGLSSGIYFYKLQTGSFIDTKKMIFIK